MILFAISSYLLIIIFFANCSNLRKEQFRIISSVAVISWVSKMFFAILFPHLHPWFRKILGFNGIMYFAGDE